jgi:hypothetical protein
VTVQAPLSQLPLEHCVPSTQAAPSSCTVTHMPAGSQAAPFTQRLSGQASPTTGSAWQAPSWQRCPVHS